MFDRMLCPLNEAMKTHGERPAIHWGSRRISFAQLNQYVNAALRSFKERGIRAGHRVAFVSDNSVEFVIVLLGLWRLGAVALPINPKFPPEQIKALLVSLKVQVVVTVKAFMGSISRPPCPVIDITDLIVYNTKDAFFSGQAPDVFMDPQQEAAIILTSGSSGVPKAAVLTYGNLYFNAAGSNECVTIDQTSAWLLSLPLYHVSGLGILLRCLIARAAIVVAPREETVRLIAEGKVTHISMVTTQLHRMLGDPVFQTPQNLRAILLGGSAIPKNLLQRALGRRLPVYVSYGLTEMASQVATGRVDNTDQPCAKVLPFRELKISPDGEICVRGKTLFKGYAHGDAVSPAVDQDGWFHTGDAGGLDKNGCLAVLGRKDNMFISGGENIHPEEIEAALLKIKSLLRAVVVPQEDAEFGQRPVAFIRWEDDIAVYKDAVLTNQLLKELPKFKIPVAFYAWPSQTEDEGLKIDRRRFQEIVRQKQQGKK